MMRANIYSPEPLAPEVSRAVSDGIDMVATYIGQTVAINEFRVNLPHDQDGSVNPKRVGLAKLDGMVELHVMALPLMGNVNNALGIGAMGQGYSFVDTSPKDPHVIRTVSAHETAHSLGFVLPGSEQENPENSHHCSDESCVMSPRINVFKVLKPAVQERIGPRKLFSRRSTVDLPATYEVHGLRDQNDFCLPCKVDLRNTGEKHVSDLRYKRLLKNAKI